MRDTYLDVGSVREYRLHMAIGSEARAAAFWARRDIRRRWRTLVLMGVLVGLTVGFALASWAGARRTDTSLERLRVQTNAADAVVFPSQVGVAYPNWDRLRARPEVKSVAVWDLLFGNYNGEPQLIFGSADGTYLGKVDKPVVVKGRMLNPRSPDEVVVDTQTAKLVPLGSTFKFRFYNSKQVDLSGAPKGPLVTFHVVGVVNELAQFVWISGGEVLVSPGFVARYGSQISVAENADVLLRHGEADMGRLRHDVNADLARGTPVLDTYASSRRVTTTLDVESTALLLLAGAILLGGGILVAQVLGRSASTIADDAPSLRGLGMSRRDLGLATGISHLIAAFVAAPVTFAVALLASPHFPVGLARQVDPDVGYHVDWTLIGPGAVLVIVLVLAASMLVGRSGRHGRLRRRGRAKSSSAVRRWTPLAIGLGATMAFESGRGRRRIPVVPALLAAVVAVTGVLASLTIDRGISNALHHPELAGVTWDASVTPATNAQTGRNVTTATARRILESKGVDATAVVDRDVINVDNVGAPVFVVRPLAGTRTTSISFTLISGRAPRGLGEAAIGPATAKDLRVGVGDTVTVGASHERVTIVGEVLFPSDVHSEFDEGIWLAPRQFDAVIPPIGPNGSDSDGRVIAVSFASGTSSNHGIQQLQAALGPLATDIEPSDVPDELENLRNLQTLPDVLAIFLGLIAIAALGSVLLSCSYRRGHEFAVLRALGMTRRNIRTVLNSQGTAIGLFGLLIGIPLGIGVGRLGWRAIAERVPLSEVPPLALTAALLLIPVTIIAANVLALWPGRVALSHNPAEELRVE
jgi:ABC-type lipoprotein release transport system permease subunit